MTVREGNSLKIGSEILRLCDLGFAVLLLNTHNPKSNTLNRVINVRLSKIHHLKGEFLRGSRLLVRGAFLSSTEKLGFKVDMLTLNLTKI